MSNIKTRWTAVLLPCMKPERNHCGSVRVRVTGLAISGPCTAAGPMGYVILYGNLIPSFCHHASVFYYRHHRC